jgi:hypothetical protein
MSSDMLLLAHPGLLCERAAPKRRKPGRVAVKVLNHYGDEVMRVFRL